jgi:hypothetical protein
VNGQKAAVIFAGLAPGLIGLYQINATIPAGMAVGLATFEVAGPDSDTLEAVIPIGVSGGGDAASALGASASAPNYVAPPGPSAPQSRRPKIGSRVPSTRHVSDLR